LIQIRVQNQVKIFRNVEGPKGEFSQMYFKMNFDVFLAMKNYNDA
jgi:hypothetical protein